MLWERSDLVFEVRKSSLRNRWNGIVLLVNDGVLSCCRELTTSRRGDDRFACSDGKYSGMTMLLEYYLLLSWW
jgi:hypothetical protein